MLKKTNERKEKMAEQIIISSKKRSLKKFNIGVIAIGILAIIIYCIVVHVINGGYFKELSFGQSISYIIEVPLLKLVLPPVLLILLIANFIYYCSKFSIVVTDKSVKGRVIFGKEVNLPNDSLSAISKIFFHGIGASTGSGLIKFRMIENRDEIYDVLNDIISKRQSQPTTTIVNSIPDSAADELKKYSDLLAQGILTQEEFDAKKKQLLGL